MKKLIKSRTQIRGKGGRALVDVEVTLNDVKRVVAKHMVLMFANSKLQPAVVVSKKAIFVQYARSNCRTVFFSRSNNSRDVNVRRCELNQEEVDDSSFQMYENSTNREDGEGFGLHRTGTDSMTVKPYVVSVQLGNAIAHFRVALSLFIKARPGAQPFI